MTESSGAPEMPQLTRHLGFMIDSVKIVGHTSKSKRVCQSILIIVGTERSEIVVLVDVVL